MKKVNSKLLKDSLTRNEMRVIAGGGSFPNTYEIFCNDGLQSRGLPRCSGYAYICDDHGGVNCCVLEDTGGC